MSQNICGEDEDESQPKSGERLGTEDNGMNGIDCEESSENSNNISINSCENIENVIMDDKKNKKLIHKVMVPTKKSAISVFMKEDFLHVLRNAFAFHRLRCGAKLMHALSRDPRTPHFVILKSALILFTQNTDNCDNNSLLTQSMKKISIYDINRKEIMLEIILNFLRNHNINGAKEYIEANQTCIKYNIYRNHAIIDAYLKCYISYCDYLEWKQLINESQFSIYYRSNDSLKIISDKTKLALKNVINQCKDCQFDVFVLILLEMYEYSEQYEEAIHLLEMYIDLNKDHLNAYIYLYDFCLKHTQHSTDGQILNALKNISRLSPQNVLTLELVKKNVLSVKHNFELIMEFIDYTANMHNIDAWLLLKDLLYNQINNKKITQTIINQWRQKYKFYWQRFHFNISFIHSFDDNSLSLIRCKQQIITFLESESHQYIIQTNQILNQHIN